MIAKISWVLWTAGTIVVVMSWTHTVTPQVGWIGFGIGLAGSVLSWFQKRGGRAAAARPSSAVSDLDRLVQLRDRGDITEEQYLRQRNAILGEPGGRKPEGPSGK